MDNNQDNPTQDLKQEEGIQEQEFKFVIIGGNEPKVNDSFLKSLGESEVPVTIFELTTEEMKFIIHSRATKKAEEVSVDYLNDSGNKERVSNWVNILIKSHLERINSGKPKDLEYFLKRALDGEEEVYFTKKTLKQASKLSWSQFTELFKSMELFGVIKYTNEENPDLFTLIVNNEDIIKNQLVELKQFVNITIGKIQVLQKETKLDPKKKTSLESVKKSLIKISDKI